MEADLDTIIEETPFVPGDVTVDRQEQVAEMTAPEEAAFLCFQLMQESGREVHMQDLIHEHIGASQEFQEACRRVKVETEREKAQAKKFIRTWGMEALVRAIVLKREKADLWKEDELFQLGGEEFSRISTLASSCENRIRNLLTRRKGNKDAAPE